ncbi:MAG: aminopeptidase [bacterium]|nr:MAG: aminopeptidase [bacterium]
MPSDKPSIENAVQSLLEVNMGLQENERLLILGDSAGDGGALAREVGEVAEKLHPQTRTLIFDPVGGHGQEPPEEVWSALLGSGTAERLRAEGLLSSLLAKGGGTEIIDRSASVIEETGGFQADVIVAVTHYSTSHTSFRKLLTQICGARYASMPLFERDMFFGSMDVDWKDLAISTNVLARTLIGADRCEISSANGTRLVLGVAGRLVIPDDGLLTERGKFGNLPAGEVFLAPVEGTAEGVLVLEWGPQARFKSPIRAVIQNGRVVSVEGEDSGEVGWLEGILSAHPENRNIAELGIGTNPSATRPDNVLESEKILGTIHVAFGDNHTFGGAVKAPLHQDFVLFEATLVAVWECGGGRRVLLDEGKKGW